MSARDERIVRVGSRKSELALIQTRYVISRLRQLRPDKEFEIVTMTTLGDRVLNISLPKIGEKSLFTKDLEEALENGSVDLVVHSLKDLPTALPKNMAIGAVLEREDPRDALVLREDFKGHTLDTLPKGSIIGTSSLRRTAQISRTHPHLTVVDIRGNLNTRLKKLDQNFQNNCPKSNAEKRAENPNYAALVLAQAGLVRMGWQERISQVLPSTEVLYAIGQGALAIECRADHQKILDMIAPLNHADTYCRILAERTFLRTLGGGCSAPVAISTNIDEDRAVSSNVNKRKMEITGAVWSLDGQTKLQESIVHSFAPFVNLASKKSCPYDSALKLNCPISSNIKQEVKRRPNGGVNCVENIDEAMFDSILNKMENDHVSYSSVNDTESKKSKLGGKHKLNNASDSTDDCDEPNVKHNKTSEDAVCPRNDAVAASDDKCCRLKSLNEVMNSVEPVDIENLISFHEKLLLPCRKSVNGVCPVFKFPPNFLESLGKLHPEVHNFERDFEKCPLMANQVVANAILTGNEGKIIPKYDIDNPKKCTFLLQKKQEEVRHAINGIREIVESIKVNGSSDTMAPAPAGSSKEAAAKEIKLFCGLSKHFDIAEDVLDKFEDLGRRLAQNLIDRGALDIMKCAQDYIRGTVNPTASIASRQ